MSTPTANYGLIKPDVNNADDADLWGGMLNGDMDDLDGLLKTAVNFVKSSKTANFSITAPTVGTTTTGDAKKLFRCDATSAAFAATLPAASAGGNGFTIAFKKTDASVNAVTITAAGSDKIDGAATFVLSAQYNWAILVSDGVSAWDILSDTATQNVITYTPPTTQTFLSGSGTYTCPTPSPLYIKVKACGGGGGGGARSTNSGTGGGTTTFGSFTAIGGSGGGPTSSPPALGGTGGSGSALLRVAGQNGLIGLDLSPSGGNSLLGLGGSGNTDGGPGGSATGYGGGGGAADTAAGNTTSPSGGGGGEYIEFYINSPSTTYSYSVGGAGTGGSAGGQAGGNGTSGIIIVQEFYQ